VRQVNKALLESGNSTPAPSFTTLAPSYTPPTR
jgi:hypothetical protein